MKKLLKIVLIIVAVVVIAFFALVLPKTVSMIEEYPRFTFEYVTQDTALVADFGIGDNRDPGDYGYPGFVEVDYPSLLDGTQLNGWYVAANKDSITQTLVISHGRTSNRLKTMKYLQLSKNLGSTAFIMSLSPTIATRVSRGKLPLPWVINSLKTWVAS